MARRSDHNREELYALAMQAARDIAVHDGLKGLTARNIAKRIGYSAGTLYNLFKNLDEIALHVNAGTLDQLHDRLGEVALSGKPKKDIRQLLDAYLDFIGGNDRLWSLLFDHKLPDGTPLPDWYRARIARVLSLLEAALAPLFPEPDHPECQLSARVLWSSLHGICQLANADKLEIVSDEDTRALAHALVENYLAGLKARLG
ncbi:TetR/AcrR family transcriptional regulator [Aestuariispira insulae]|uniref:TetR family transcriptional regulator n=1 Tax=Aestuariispira insulae TaxID=1461337 RepID=A0A3D9HHK1_9PROT|nr:TetR/AcrR family transcriptional regulator [Aestuariispira insulae]RED49032.1 TetR family transcriptional regulator [Aestuariispira insulae]